MINRIRAFGVVAILLFTISAALAQGAGGEWDRLNQEVIEHYRAGEHDLAAAAARKALRVAEKNVGPDHPDVAASLDTLAEIHMALGRYAVAEPLFQRSLAISEKALGPDHTDVAVSLNNLAELYLTQGRYARAEPLFKRSLEIL